MAPIDAKLATWAQDNGLDPEFVFEVVGVPSEWNYSADERTLEELQHILNDGNQDGDLEVPLPDEFLAYRLGKWAGKKVPPTHPLVVDHVKWRNVYIDSEFDSASQEDVIQLLTLVRSIAGRQLAMNLPTDEDIAAHFEQPSHSASIYAIQDDNGPLFIAPGDDKVVFLNNEGEIRVYSYEGDRMHRDEGDDRIRQAMMQQLKASRPLTDRGEVASLIGNDLATILLDGDISLFDLP